MTKEEKLLNQELFDYSSKSYVFVSWPFCDRPETFCHDLLKKGGNALRLENFNIWRSRDGYGQKQIVIKHDGSDRSVTIVWQNCLKCYYSYHAYYKTVIMPLLDKPLFYKLLFYLKNNGLSGKKVLLGVLMLLINSNTWKTLCPSIVIRVWVEKTRTWLAIRHFLEFFCMIETRV